MENETKLTIRRPDDFHVHFRDGEMLQAVAPLTAKQFGRAIIMPNLKPPIRTMADAKSYRERILASLPHNHSFTPLMTLYLTDATTRDDICAAHASGFVHACKLYPAGATTNSDAGVTSLDALAPALEQMQELGMVLCVHGEATAPEVDVFDREARFVRDTLPQLLDRFPRLKTVLEHVTTSQAVDVVKRTNGNRLAATITAHHLLYSRQAIFAGAKIHPHMFCLPVLKRETHRQALLRAVAEDTEGKFFAGTDSAPHLTGAKICEDGCAGIFTGDRGLELYAEAFEEAGVLHKLERFVSENGAKFYGLELNDGTVCLSKQVSRGAAKIDVAGKGCIVPLRAGQDLEWTLETS